MKNNFKGNNSNVIDLPPLLYIILPLLWILQKHIDRKIHTQTHTRAYVHKN